MWDADVEILEASGGKHYVKSFLINTSRNGNGWRVTWDSIKENAKSFIGKPGTAYVGCDDKGCDLDHPPVQKDYQSQMASQEPHRVSTIVDIKLDESTQTAYAIHEVHNDQFSDAVKQGKIKYVSPSISGKMHFDGMGDKPYIMSDQWTGLHLAWVGTPAYAKQDAKVEKQCEGDECLPTLQASGCEISQLCKKVDDRILRNLAKKLPTLS